MTSSPNVSSKSRFFLYSNVPPKVKGLILSLSFNELGVGYLIVLITAYLPTTGFSPDSVGLLIGVFGLVTVLTAIPLGIISDKSGRKRQLILGSIGFPIGMIVFALTSNLLYLVGGATILGFSEAATLTTWNAIIADQTTKENRNHAFSLSFVVSIIAMGLGSSIPFAFPFLQTFLVSSSLAIHRNFMILFALLALLSPLLFIILLRKYVEVVGNDQEELKRGRNMKTLLKFSGINSLIGLGAGLIIPLVPLWFLLKFGVPDTYSGPLFTVASITIGFAAIAGPKLASRYGQVRSIALTEGASTIFMISLAFVPSAGLAAVAYVARAVLMNTASPLADSYLMGIITPQERGLASAVNSVIWRLPNSASTIVGGFILASGRYDLPFILASIFYIVSVTLFYSVFRNVKPTV